MSAATEQTFNADIYALARNLNVLDDSNMDIEIVRKSVYDELGRQSNWLMVIDNVEDAAIIKGFLPTQRGFRHVLITIRYNGMDRVLNGHAIQLKL